MNTTAQNRLQVIIALSGFALGLITIYAPTWLLLRRFPGNQRDAFLDLHPEKRPLIIFYEIVFFINLLASPFYSLIWSNHINPWMQPFFLFCCAANSIGIVNGIFECITGICPKRGINYRLSYRQNYLLHPAVRKAGLLRICLGIFFIGASFLLSTCGFFP